MRKVYRISNISNPILVIAFILCNSFEVNLWIQSGLALLFFINMFVLLVSSYKSRRASRSRESEIAGEVIAAIEAKDYVNAQVILQKFKNSTRLGDAFHFYILGVLSERTKTNDDDMIDRMDGMRERLFSEKNIEDED